MGALLFFSFIYSCALLYPLYKQYVTGDLLRSAMSHQPGKAGFDLSSGSHHSPNKESTRICNSSSEKQCPEVLHTELTSPAAHDPAGAQAWSFNKTRDERAYGLYTAQCYVTFPGLFADIERAIVYRKNSRSYIPEDIDISWKQDGAVRAAILNQQVVFFLCLRFGEMFLTHSSEQLYIHETRLSGSDHEAPRIFAILHALHRAIINSPIPLPDIEFSFSTSDILDPEHFQKSNMGVITYSRRGRKMAHA